MSAAIEQSLEKFDQFIRSEFEGQKQEDGHQFKFLSIGEMRRNYKPTDWLIDGFLEDGGLSMLFGESTAGKSLLVIDWACCIACGRDWHGREIVQGPVFVLAGEGFGGFVRRVRAWEIFNGAQIDDAPLHFSERPAALMDGKSTKAVTAAVREMAETFGKPRLVVVDTMHRNMGEGDENSAADFAVFLQSLDFMRSELGCAILIVHHAGHGDGNRGRGSSSIKASMDQEFRLSKEADGRRQLTCSKMKDGAPPPAMFLDLQVVELDLLDAKGRPDTSAVLSLGENQEAPPPAKKERTSGALDYVQQAILVCGSNQKEVVRTQFYALYPGNQDAKQKAFARGWKSYMEALS